MNVEYQPCPTAAHHMHGKIEQKIRQIKQSIEKTVINQQLSVLQWEILAAETSNSVNDLPLVIGNSTVDLKNQDLMTPNSNDRSPTGLLLISNNPKLFLQDNEDIFNAWFESW